VQQDDWIAGRFPSFFKCNLQCIGTNGVQHGG
jgi:hypothetical protein